MTRYEAPQLWKALTWCLAAIGLPSTAVATLLVGRVVDAASGQLLPARVYIQDQAGNWFYPKSNSPEGSAIPYQKQNWVNRNAVEYHTTLSAHPFRIDLEPGPYLLVVERGKEYRPLNQRLVLQDQPVQLQLKLERWVNMSKRGWFSGDTHVHRTVAELSNVSLAEDLNVALPLTYWVTKSGMAPAHGDKTQPMTEGPRLIEVDPTHVICPQNTEYEIFSVAGKQHTLGALFILNHTTPFTAGVPPLSPVVRRAREENALLDLDKHNWPWSIAIIPLAQPDLFELANNHHWRTEFALTNFGVAAPEWMNIATGSANEKEWTLYGFQTYYTLLNCGFRLRPSAGTANGVHPVPLGFSRVYVQCPSGFSYKNWIQGLDAGRSFVTTGPMLLAEWDGHPPGHRFFWKSDLARQVHLSGIVLSEHPIHGVEIIHNGRVLKRLPVKGRVNSEGAWEASFHSPIEVRGTSWLAVRCWEGDPSHRIRFAHTAPVFIDVEAVPLRPRAEEIRWLILRTEEEIRRSIGILPESAVSEYRQALATYQAIAKAILE